MAELKLSHIYKVYPNGVKAVSDFNIDIDDCEFIVFVGPSGCGKSTTLRMIAGLEDITAGDLYIGETLVNDLQPKDRDIAMVFQNYALYPHLTVYENMAFGLKNRHMAKDEINKRVLEAARILDIEDYLQRKPKAMSGGQRQRVALGRAIVRQPKVFLLDEPLSNLDAKLRAQMRTEITKLHQRLKTTFIYVTHDQVEAMTMGTRIVVMKKGFVQQIDTPTNLYDHPINRFVAGFIGTPQMNFFDITLERNHQKNQVALLFEDRQKYLLDEKYFIHADRKYLDGSTHVTLGIRPDYLVPSEKGHLKFVVTSIEALGNETLLYCTLGDAYQSTSDESIDSKRYIMRVDPGQRYEIGQKIKADLVGDKIQLFSNDDEMTVMPFVPQQSRAQISFKGGEYQLFGRSYPRLGIFKDIPDGSYEVLIPHGAIVPGDQYELPVAEVLPLPKSRYLVTLYDAERDTYLFAIAADSVEVGSSYRFGLIYSQMILDESLGVKPVKQQSDAKARFVRVKEGREIVWYLDIDGAQYRLENRLVAKLANIEGRKLLNSEYRVAFAPLVWPQGSQPSEEIRAKMLPARAPRTDRKTGQLGYAAASEGLKHRLVKSIDAGYHQYRQVELGGTIDDIEVTGQPPADDYVIQPAADSLEVYTLDTEIRLA